MSKAFHLASNLLIELTEGTSASKSVLAASVVTPRLTTGKADRMGALYRKGAATARGVKRDSILAAILCGEKRERE